MPSDLPPYEKLGAFYLGRLWDAEEGETESRPLLYDSQDLLTHAVCVGMTGSGKTGLCIDLLEEAAIDGVPALIVDPKGDLGNLLLTFPGLEAADFLPWVDDGEATRRGQSREDYAAAQAELWRRGLAEWGQDGGRIRRLKEAAETAIYTPGSEAGLPVSILGSLAAPPAAVLEDADLLADRVETLASSLLGLLERDADPVTSRDHILLSTLLTQRWSQGAPLDLATLIQLIQSPPVERVGVLDLETFYPAKERFQLALALNNLMASPSMASWLSGTPLDVDRLLYTESGKPRLAVLSIAHLSEQQRMFFVSLLLNEVVAWVRSRPGTTSLRAILYMDEVFGFLPPVAQPPSKKPLLTLLKQARAYGLGVVLATQNPADLDYKALSNAGTWFLGRLQTERDKQRVLEGLEGAAAGGAAFDRGEMEATLAGLGKRVFLLHNVHEAEPVLFQTRWALSYLRGPLTRLEIKRLMDVRLGEGDREGVAVEAARPADAAPSAAPAPPATGAAETAPGPPVLPPEVPQAFFTARGRPGEGLLYRPTLLGQAMVHFVDSRRGIEHAEAVALHLDLAAPSGVDWYAAEELPGGEWDPERDLESQPVTGAAFAPLPDAAAQARSYKAWEKDLADVLYRSRRCQLFKSPTFDEVSRPGESERDFRIRLTDKAREMRDEAKAELRRRYEAKIDRKEDEARRAEHRLEREQEQAKAQKQQSWLAVGETALGVFLGRKRLSRTNVRRASSAMRSFSRAGKEAGDVERAEEALDDVREELEALEAELAAELDALPDRFDPLQEELEPMDLKPRRSDVDVRRVALAWAPYRHGDGGALTPAWR